MPLRPMTMAEKILAAHAGLDEIVAGEIIECHVDGVLANDVTAPLAIDAFRKTGASSVFDPDRIFLVPDHYTPNKDIASAEQVSCMRAFAREQGISHFFEVGRGGIEHALLPEKGLVVPGDLFIGADSHTCTYGALGAFSTGMGSTDIGCAMATGFAWFKVPETIRICIEGACKPTVSAKDLILYILGILGVDGALYRAIEFCGSTVMRMSVEQRLTMSNMAIEAGAKAGLVEADDLTAAYLSGRAKRSSVTYRSDDGARFMRTIEIDASAVEPMIALPYLPSNVKPLSAIGSIPVDQVLIGSCTNGRIEDMRMAARVLKGRTVAEDVRCIVIPATCAVQRQMIEEGIYTTLLDAGCAISTPTCGPCLGGHMGVLAAGETAVSTTNRNFVGRMGSVRSSVYLASPYVAASSAVLGHIGLLEELRSIGSASEEVGSIAS